MNKIVAKVDLSLDENNVDLKDDWEIATLGKIASYIQRGKSPKYTEHSDLAVINQKCIRWNGVDRTYVKYIDPEQFEKFTEERFLQNGDILWNSTGTGTIGRAAIVQLKENEKLVADSHVTIVRANGKTDPRYVHYWIMSPRVQNSIEDMQSGSTNQVELSKKAVESTPIPLAPLDQQKQIVAKVEELFSHIDAGVVALKKAKLLLKQYRQSVLKAAVTGELTKEWREQNKDRLEPASELLKRILAERRSQWEEQQFEQFKAQGKVPKDDKWKLKYKEPKRPNLDELPTLPNEWTWATLTQLGEIGRGKSKHRPRNDSILYGDSYPFIQTGDVKAANGILNNFTQMYSEAGLNQSKMWPKGTLCITIAANIADTAVLGLDACFPDSVVGFIPLSKFYIVELAELFFRTIKDDLERFAPATAQKNINLEVLEYISLPLLSIEEQRVLVNIVKEKLAIADRLNEQLGYQTIIAEKNKQSILASAFSGMLVKQPIDI